MSLILKSNRKYLGNSPVRGVSAYIDRVKNDGGVINDITSLENAYMEMERLGLDGTNIFSAVSPQWGIKLGVYGIEKMYSLFDSSGDMLKKASTSNANLGILENKHVLDIPRGAVGYVSEGLHDVLSYENLVGLIAGLPTRSGRFISLSENNTTSEYLLMNYTQLENTVKVAGLRTTVMVDEEVPYTAKSIASSISSSSMSTYINGELKQNVDTSNKPFRTGGSAFYLGSSVAFMPLGKYHGAIYAHNISEDLIKDLSVFMESLT